MCSAYTCLCNLQKVYYCVPVPVSRRVKRVDAFCHEVLDEHVVGFYKGAGGDNLSACCRTEATESFVSETVCQLCIHRRVAGVLTDPRIHQVPHLAQQPK